MPTDDTLAVIERFYDTVPRATARTEQIGPFTLFVAERGWPYYARPRLGGTDSFFAADIVAVRSRQRELGVPEQFEWVHELAPSLLAAAQSAGLAVQRCPLLLLGELAEMSYGGDIDVRLLGPDDPELQSVRAAVDVGFRHDGTDIGAASAAERDQAAASAGAGADVQRALMADGLLRAVGAFGPQGAVGGGSYSARDGVAEITGVAVLPAWRRQGLGAAITAALAVDAQAHDVGTVFCSAESDEVARVYGRIGFRRIGTACIAEPAH